MIQTAKNVWKLEDCQFYLDRFELFLQILDVLLEGGLHPLEVNQLVGLTRGPGRHLLQLLNIDKIIITALVKQMSLFDTALVMTKTKIQNKNCQF